MMHCLMMRKRKVTGRITYIWSQEVLCQLDILVSLSCLNYAREHFLTFNFFSDVIYSEQDCHEAQNVSPNDAQLKCYGKKS